jgi:ribonuclease T2
MRLLLAALLLGPSAAALAQDWSGAAGSLHPRFQRAPVSAQAVPFSPGSEQAGRFDYYLLSLEWHPTFCAAHARLDECAPGTSDRYDDELVLHGMWPSVRGDSSNSYGFCGVPQSVRQLDTAATRCRMPEVPMSSSTRGTLAAHMPGTDACLERHEWYRHGTCSGLSGDDYFAAADAMLLQANRSALGRFVSAHKGESVPASDLLAAAQSDWGGAAASAVRLTCQNGSLNEVRIALAPGVTASSSLASSLARAEGGSSCPVSVRIPAGAGFTRR